MKDHSWITKVLLNMKAYADHHGLTDTGDHLAATLAASIPEVAPDQKQPRLRVVGHKD